MIIREITTQDTESLAQLLTELGYPTTPAEITERLRHITATGQYRTLVACVEDRVVGMIGATRACYYEKNGSYVRILVLVTRAEYKRRGIGSALIRSIGDWARDLGASTLLLNCGNRPERQAAHAFYQRLGFSAASTGYSLPVEGV